MASNSSSQARLATCDCVKCDKPRVVVYFSTHWKVSADTPDIEKRLPGQPPEELLSEPKVFHLADGIPAPLHGQHSLLLEMGPSTSCKDDRSIGFGLPKWNIFSKEASYHPLSLTHHDDGCGEHQTDKSMKSRRLVWDKRKTVSFLFALVSLIALFLVFSSPSASSSSSSAVSDSQTWPEDGYVRYPSPGSNGPKRQLRILYDNATEWSHNNPHDNGEWRIRIDDQALIPAAAWDDEEDRYQKWFADRYEVMNDVVKTRNYIRPAWLGSLNVSVPWDDEFHLAHCVVTMKRYWKAKETGKHVCPRDIAPPHIQHCLNWLEGIVFKPEPGLPDMGPAMAWQTKVCY